MKSLAPLVQRNIESLDFEKLSFSHEDGVPLLDKVDFSFPTRAVVLVRGKEGAGVSTLFRILGGLKVPTAGAYRINALDAAELSGEERIRCQLSMGFGFAHGGLLSNYSLLDNLLLPLNFHALGSKEDRMKRAKAYLEFFEIDSYANHLPAFTTAAARKACVLARSLVLCPRLLLLDEPAQGLHTAGVNRLADLIEWHRKEMGLEHIYLATENETFLNRFSYKMIELQNKGLRHGSR